MILLNHCEKVYLEIYVNKKESKSNKEGKGGKYEKNMQFVRRVVRNDLVLQNQTNIVE